MFKLSGPALAGKSCYLRYVYFLVSGFRFKSYRAWREAGEPNPFVKKSYRHQATHRVEYIDIFAEFDRR